MSWENEDDSLSLRSLVGCIAPDSDQKNWKPRVMYSRDFLLSLSESDVCKKLPTDLDKSVLSDLEQAANTVSERQRSVGNLALQGPRRGEHGFQSLNRSENSISYVRRWDTRSSGSNDREGDLQFDRESITQDSGKRFGNQNQRTRPHQEHDGLLGSGALARPSGYAGTSVSKVRCNDPLQLSRSTEPYQPPRPCKAAPYSRKDVTDSCNDETFGSSDCSDKDKAEERKRRESFELMRKEQQKALQVKQHKGIIKGNHAVDLMDLLDSSNTDKSTTTRSKPDDSVTDSLPPSDSSKSFSHAHVPAARPLVPPGFANALVEKNQQINKLKNSDLQISNENENLSASSSADVDFSNSSFSSSGLREVNEVCEEDILNDHFHKQVAGPDRVDAVTQDQSTSIFDKLFGNAVVKNSENLGSDNQNHASKEDEEARTRDLSASSKFAHLFHEESEGQPIEKKLIQDKSSRDLLSLFASQGYMSSNNEATERNQPILPSKNNVFLSSSTHSSVLGMPLESHQGDKQSHSCAVLTCEDLEQAILAEAKDRSSGKPSILAEVKDRCSVKQSIKQEPWTAVDTKSEEHNDAVDDHASQHLLSLLQRGANSKESVESPRLDAIGSPEIFQSPDIESNLLQISDDSSHSLYETERKPEKSLTLESLFGSAFMNELHSMEAPVSAQKTLVGRVTDIGANQLPLTLDTLASSSDEQFLKKNVFDGEMSQLSNVQQLSNAAERMSAHKNAGNWAGYSPPLHSFKVGDVAFEQTARDILLPEEDSLISLNDSLDMVTSTRLHESLGSKKTVVGDLSDKLNAILRVGDSSRETALDYLSHGHASHEMVDTDSHHHHRHHHHPHARATPQFPHQMNHGRPFFPSHLDHSAFRNSQINFGSPDAMHLDPHHPFSSNAFAHHNYNNFSGQQLDPSAHHGMLQALQLSENFPSHNTVQCLPHVPFSQPMNHALDFSHDVNSRHAPPRHRQVNYGGLGMGMPGPVGSAGRPPPEIYERLIEMEMRANSKFQPAVPEHVFGFYGAEFESNSRYR